MDQTQKSPQDIIKAYKKGNREYKKTLLRRYGVKKIEDVSTLLDNSTSVKELTKNELSRVLMNHPLVKMEVSFNKQLTEESVLEGLMYIYQKVALVDVKDSFKKLVKNTINGVETTRTIMHNCKTDSFGRLFATDMNKEQKEGQKSSSKMILIDLGRLNWLKINDVVYKLKN